MVAHNTSPVAVIANVAEAFWEFLDRDPNPDSRAYRIRTEQYRGDRTLIWAGDPKLVITSFPVPSLDFVRQTLGFLGTEVAYPSHPSELLCSDILHQSDLFNRLVEYAGPARKLTLIPYATTPQFVELVEALKSKAGLAVSLPETPLPHNQWLLHYLDTKAGFRSLVSGWLSNSPVQLPEGFICQTPKEAAQVAQWFTEQKRPCIIKANMGTNGYGNFIVSSDQPLSEQQIAEKISSDPFFGLDLVVVEELVVSENSISPSLECFVPPASVGSPQLTYICTQLFENFGEFCGVVVSKEQRTALWYAPLVEAGLEIARNLQLLGYVGHFDMDAVVDDAGRPYPVEINPRRTGGTHVHDFASYVFGPNYLEQVTLLSRDPVNIGPAMDFSGLLKVLDGLWYPIDNKPRGIIPTVSSPIYEGEFGCLILGDSQAEVLDLQSKMLRALSTQTER